MAKAKLTVTAPDGRVYTRRSDNPYTHAVVSKGTPLAQLEAQRERLIASERKIAAEYRATIERQGDAHWRYNGVVEKQNAYSEWIAGILTRIEEQEARDLKAEYLNDIAGEWYVTYHRRIDLAQKEAAKRREHQEQVYIVEVK